MNTILMTGGSGFIGSHFHEVWAQNKIVNLDLVPPAFPCQSVYCNGDVRDYHSIDRILEQHPCDTIISLAAEHEDFGVSSEAFFKTNAQGTANLCKAATKHGIRNFVFYSSVSVYGKNTGASTEATQSNPVDAYGASKLAAEKELQKWVEEDPGRKVLIIRPVVVYGERNTANMHRLIKQIDSGLYFNLGKGKNVKSIAYVKNIVDATLFLMENMQPGIALYNYADNPQMRSSEIVEVICDALGRRKPINLPFAPVLAMGYPFDWFIKLTGIDLPISTNRIKKLYTQTYHSAAKIFDTGFNPVYDNIEGIKNMVDWYKVNLADARNDDEGEQEKLPYEPVTMVEGQSPENDKPCRKFYASSTV